MWPTEELTEHAREVSGRWWVEAGRQRNVPRFRHIDSRNVDLEAWVELSIRNHCSGETIEEDLDERNLPSGVQLKMAHWPWVSL